MPLFQICHECGYSFIPCPGEEPEDAICSDCLEALDPDLPLSDSAPDFEYMEVSDACPGL